MKVPLVSAFQNSKNILEKLSSNFHLNQKFSKNYERKIRWWKARRV